MFDNRKKSDLQHARDALLAMMCETDPLSEEYAEMVGQVKTLSELVQKEHPVRDPLNINSLIPAAATLASVGLIIWHERDHVIVTKALNFLPKLI